MGGRVMEEQITIDQHYVPRFYMKNFAIIRGEGKKEKSFISFFQFDKKISRENIPTKSVCYEKYFYGENGNIEKMLAAKEGKWGKTINKIVSKPEEKLLSEDMLLLKEFGVYQYGRTLAMFNYNKQAISDILTDSFSNFNPHVDSEMIREKVDDKIQNEMFASQIVELSNEVVNELNDLGVTVIEFETQGKLITSDMPVVMTNPFSIDNAGMANVGVVMMYPISEKVLILIYDSKIYTSLKQYMKDDNEEDVVSLNKYQVLSAEERIMSDKLENLVAIMQDRDVCEKREKFREKKKVDSSYDGVGTFFAMHSRSMKYSFPISFFKLPRAIRKIPVECREAFRRKYDRDTRIALLCRIYRLPDLLKDNKDFPKSEIRKQKEGYSKLLKFMDDYWEVPITERTITPELMHKLKTVPTTYYPLDNR